MTGRGTRKKNLILVKLKLLKLLHVNRFFLNDNVMKEILLRLEWVPVVWLPGFMSSPKK